MQRTPGGEGLYDARFEHDACGVGFVVDVSGRRSREIVSKGLRVLANLEHRGACGCESDTGDGAGLLVQTPHRFFARECEEIGIALPAAGAYAIGNVFLPQKADAREQCEAAFAQAAEARGHGVLGWRQVPTDASTLGPTARASQPVIRQVVLRRPADVSTPVEYERRLYVLRRCVERAVRGSAIEGRELFYVPSLSSRTIVYKGMLSTAQLPRFYPDVVDAEFESALVMVHSRFSTNTFPSWSRAHPYRLISHNGEINTLRGNVTWMHAREALLRSDLFDVSQVRPVIDPDGSDSAMFDNVLELLYMGGRSPAARDDDDDPGAVERARVDGTGATELLSVPRLPDGAVGRTGGDRLHRRNPDRGGARSQRPSAVALLRDLRRARRDGVRGRGARAPGRIRG